jgi:hypothetical protein
MSLDTYTLLVFFAGLLAGIGITLTASTVPALLVAVGRIWRYSRKHPRWGIGFVTILILAEVAMATLLFGA